MCCVPLFFLRCMLPDAARQKELMESREASDNGGRLFLGVLVGSIVFSIYNSLKELL